MTAMPQTYPFTPYPPFQEPEDWRGSVVDQPTERDSLKAEQLVADATALHHERHGDHQHPWCTDCEIRLRSARGEQAYGHAPLRHPLDTRADLERADVADLDEQVRAELEVRCRSGVLGADAEDQHLENWGSPDAVRAWLTYIEALDVWQDAERIASVDCRSRVARWLLIHGRPPVDTGPPEPARSYDDLFLDREQLNELPTVEQLIHGVLPRHSYGLLIGRDGTFKTFAALDWALSLATGHTWQGRATEKIRTLYVAGEGAYGIANRVAAWERTWDIDVDPDRFTVRAAALNLHKPGPDYNHLLDVVETGGYGLVVIDTLRRVSGGADGNGSDMGAVIDNIDRIRRATDNGTVLVIAHTAKDDRDSRGYSGIEDDADFVWHAKRPDDSRRLDLKNTKSKDGPDGHTFKLHAVEAHGSLVLQAAGADETVIASESQIKLLQTLMNVFPDGAFGGALMDASGLSKSTYYRVLSDLVKTGQVTKTGSVQRPFITLTPNPDSQEGPTDDNHA